MIIGIIRYQDNKKVKYNTNYTYDIMICNQPLSSQLEQRKFDVFTQYLNLKLVFSISIYEYKLSIR